MTLTSCHPHIELVPTRSLRPNPRNARKHPDRQIAQIAASISRFGWLVPIIIDEDDMIVAGHGRWLAARQLKLAEVPVIRTAFLTDADRRAFARLAGEGIDQCFLSARKAHGAASASGRDCV